MNRYTFAVAKAENQDPRTIGMHTPTDETITVEATSEEVARSMARTELRKKTPGVQLYHPAELLSVDQVAGQPAAPAVAPQKLEDQANTKVEPGAANKPKETIQ